MPIQTPGRHHLLRREENPPYPELAIEMLREISKTISAEISPVREGIGIVRYAMNTFESQLKNHGENLERLSGMEHSIETLRNVSQKHDDKLEKVEEHVHAVKGILWFIGVVGGIAIVASAIFQVYAYFHPR